MVVGTNMINGTEYKVENQIIGKVGDYNEYELKHME